MGWLAWAAFVPWILFLEECVPRQAFRGSYLLGLLFFGGTMYWLVHVTLPGLILLVLALSLYFALWGWLANRVLKAGRPWLSLLFLPSSWVAIEYGRAHLLSGLGWNLLAHTQWNWIPFIQLAGITGVWGISFLIVLANVALCWVLKRKKSGLIAGFLVAACLAGVFFYGRRSVGILDACKPLPSYRIALLQGNVPQREKWNEEFAEAIWKRYEELSAQAAAQKPDLIVWPETSAPGYFEDSSISNRLGQLVRAHGAEMLVGLPTEDDDGRPFNSAVLLKPDGEEADRYSKIHLVPFGEFIPFKPVLSWLEKFYPVADFSPGSRFTVFKSKLPFGVLICFEDLFPELGRKFVNQGAGWLLVITNDAWFERSAASMQHLQASVFRAVENRVYVGRAANTGWTGFVDLAGRRLPPPGQIPRFKAGVAMADVPVTPPGRTFYGRWGDWFPLLCLLLTAFVGIMKFPHGNSRSA